MTGMKILNIKINNVQFIDTLSYFQQPLSSLPKSFGFDHIIGKGFFPHLMNTPKDFAYCGNIPSIEKFGINTMNPTTANACIKWHEEYDRHLRDTNQRYILHKELVKYCRLDVQVLLLAVMEFRKLFINVTELDPITRNFTLASIGLEYFRAKVLVEDEVGITPTEGYVNLRNKSKIGDSWLDLKEIELNKRILREQKIGNYYADGYIPQDKHVFEFWGCFRHSCPQCCDPNTPLVTGQQTYEFTLKKINYYEEKGYQLTQIWEHEINEEMELNTFLKDYIRSRYQHYAKIKKYGGANIRDAFFGGRTNNLFFNYICRENEIIRYLDVTSLYPSVLVKNEYPIGHPDIINEFPNKDLNYFGFIKCKVLPPQNLYIPVLPYRDNKKLIFPLCRTCIQTRDDRCDHTEKERLLIGTWFSEELKLAVSKGYKIIELIQVLHYNNKSDSIFKPYIQKWLKLKTEASGWPSSCQTNEEKNDFINQFQQIEGKN